ncbi:hypothetical protein EPVG_00356 [Emiliania huxleyi virus 201]|nr:hypothetical protein EQVG_00307 [Emiliania huxleyi virus 207]AET98243.1 hypothetical protein EPVG_00356 [Emiliania huxleyi virus 201]
MLRSMQRTRWRRPAGCSCLSLGYYSLKLVQHRRCKCRHPAVETGSSHCGYVAASSVHASVSRDRRPTIRGRIVGMCTQRDRHPPTVIPHHSFHIPPTVVLRVCPFHKKILVGLDMTTTGTWIVL